MARKRLSKLFHRSIVAGITFFVMAALSEQRMAVTYLFMLCKRFAEIVLILKKAYKKDVMIWGILECTSCYA